MSGSTSEDARVAMSVGITLLVMSVIVMVPSSVTMAALERKVVRGTGDLLPAPDGVPTITGAYITSAVFTALSGVGLILGIIAAGIGGTELGNSYSGVRQVRGAARQAARRVASYY